MAILTARPAKRVWNKDDDDDDIPVVEARLLNRGKSNLWLSDVTYGEYEPARHSASHNSWVTVEDVHGRELPTACHLDTWDTEPVRYRLLPPGQSMEWSALVYCRDFGVGGRFKVTVHYWDRNPTPPMTPASAVLLSVRVDSEPAWITVVVGSGKGEPHR